MFVSLNDLSVDVRCDVCSACLYNDKQVPCFIIVLHSLVCTGMASGVFAVIAVVFNRNRTCPDGSSFTWHQRCQCCINIFPGYSEKHYKMLVTHVERHASTVSLLQWKIVLYALTTVLAV